MFLVLIGFWSRRPGRVGTGLPWAAKRLAALFWADVARNLNVHEERLFLKNGFLTHESGADCNIMVALLAIGWSEVR